MQTANPLSYISNRKPKNATKLFFTIRSSRTKKNLTRTYYATNDSELTKFSEEGKKFKADVEEDNRKYKHEQLEERRKAYAEAKSLTGVRGPYAKNAESYKEKVLNDQKNLTQEKDIPAPLNEPSKETVKLEDYKPNITKEQNEADIKPSDDVMKIPIITLNEALKIMTQTNKNTGLTIALLGSSKSGKTTMLTSMLPVLQKDNIMSVFSNSLQSPAYADIKEMDNCLFFDYFDKDLVETTYKVNHLTKNHYKFMNVLDDIVDQKNSELLSKCFTVFRNSNISTILSIQDPILIKKTNRGNINYIFLKRFNNNEMVQNIVDKFVGGYLTGRIEEKCAKYKRLTEGFNTIFIDMLNDCIYLIK